MNDGLVITSHRGFSRLQRLLKPSDRTFSQACWDAYVLSKWGHFVQGMDFRGRRFGPGGFCPFAKSKLVAYR